MKTYKNKKVIQLFHFLLILSFFIDDNISAAGSENSKSFSIKTPKFEVDYKGECDTDAEIGGVDKDGNFSVKGKISMREGRYALWCYNAKHTWIGKIKYAGYTFSSDKDNPLQFRVDKDKGYVYVRGKGVITGPDGKIRNFRNE